MNLIEGARTAVQDDLGACQRALLKLHALGIKHGDINKYNFLVSGYEAIIVEFETAK